MSITDGMPGDTEGTPDSAADEEPRASAPGEAGQPTGDPGVDEVLGQLDRVTHEPLDVQIEVAEQVDRVLQSRLADLGQE